MLPGVHGGLILASLVMCVSYVAENDRLVVVVTAGTEKLERPLVAGDRFGVAAEMVIGVAEAVPGVCHADEVAALAVQIQGLLATG